MNPIAAIFCMIGIIAVGVTLGQYVGGTMWDDEPKRRAGINWMYVGVGLMVLGIVLNAVL